MRRQGGYIRLLRCEAQRRCRPRAQAMPWSLAGQAVSRNRKSSQPCRPVAQVAACGSVLSLSVDHRMGSLAENATRSCESRYTFAASDCKEIKKKLQERPHGRDRGMVQEQATTRVAGVDARRATPPDLGPLHWGLAGNCQLDPSHPAFVTCGIMNLNHATIEARAMDFVTQDQPMYPSPLRRSRMIVSSSGA